MEKPSDEQPTPSDEMLAELERLIEDVGSSNPSRPEMIQFDTAITEQHKKLYQMLDDLSASVRTALCKGIAWGHTIFSGG